MSVRRICKLHGGFEGTGVTCDNGIETCCVLFRCERMPEGVPFGDVLLFGLQIDWIQRVRCHLIQSGPVYLRRWCRCRAFQSTTSVERDFLTRLFDPLKTSPVCWFCEVENYCLLQFCGSILTLHLRLLGRSHGLFGRTRLSSQEWAGERRGLACFHPAFEAPAA